MTTQRVVFNLVDRMLEVTDRKTIDVLRVPNKGENVNVFGFIGQVTMIQTTYTDCENGTVNILTNVFVYSNT